MFDSEDALKIIAKCLEPVGLGATTRYISVFVSKNGRQLALESGGNFSVNEQKL